MALACLQCGEEAVEAVSNASLLVCARCEWQSVFTKAPLLIVTGSSGVGKTTLSSRLRVLLPELCAFDKDLMPLFIPRPGVQPGRNGIEMYNDWMRIVYALAQGGRQSLICGWIDAWRLDECVDRGLLGEIHILNLHLPDEVRAQRLRARPDWRALKGQERLVESSKAFADQLLAHADDCEHFETVDASRFDRDQLAHFVAQWARSRIVDLAITSAPGS